MVVGAMTSAGARIEANFGTGAGAGVAARAEVRGGLEAEVVGGTNLWAWV